jgi:predicted RNA-binding Zn-ribbon protein involved in translation (DUF1610 family)
MTKQCPSCSGVVGIPQEAEAVTCPACGETWQVFRSHNQASLVKMPEEAPKAAKATAKKRT